MNKCIDLQATITAELSGARLDVALAQLFPTYSRSLLQQWIKQGSVTLDRTIIVKTKHTVHAEQIIHIKTTLVEQDDWAAQPLDLEVVYLDDELLIINKPVGLIVHPGAGNPDKTMVNALLFHYPDQAMLPRAGIIHRLDKDTSGLLVVARTFQTHLSLIKMMQAREIHREYRALVHGVLQYGGTIDKPMGRHPKQRTKMSIVASGKPARTHYKILEKFNKHTLLAVTLDTGRTHQIRVHMQSINHPIVGDPVYGSPGRESKHTLTHQALHAYCLRLMHPITEKAIECVAEMPEDMQVLLAALRSENV